MAQGLDGGSAYEQEPRMVGGRNAWVYGNDFSFLALEDATYGLLPNPDENGSDYGEFCENLNINDGKCSVSGIACTLRLVPGGDPRAGEWRSGVCAERERENSV